MYELASHGRKKYYKNWINYRLYSRQLLRQTMNTDLHTSRIMMALDLDEREPLQGALADMFYGCWYDVPYFGARMLAQVEHKLNPKVLADFTECLGGKHYVTAVTPLATRWSVLVSPSMRAFDHQLRISADDSRKVADSVISNLIDIYKEEEEDDEERDMMIAEVENEFFNHCIATDDRLAFSLVWWGLAKKDWEFHDNWIRHRQFFEQKIADSVRYNIVTA